MFQFFFSKPFMYCIPILYFNNLPSITYLFNICLRRRCVSSAPWEAVENISTIAGETCCCTWANRIFQDLYPLKPSSSMAKNSRVALCLFCFLTKYLQRCIIITLEHGTNIFFLMDAAQKFWSYTSRTTLFEKHALKHDRRKKDFCAYA